MKLTFLATGSRGDVQPLLALAYGARQAGWQVRFVTNAIYLDWGRTNGLEVTPIDWDPAEGIRVQLALAGLRGSAWLSGIRKVADTSDRIYRQAQAQSWRACQGSESLIYSFLSPWGLSIAERMDIPAICASLHPLTPTRQFPTPLLATDLGGAFNYLSHQVSAALLWLLTGAPFNRFRREIGLPPIRSPRPFLDLVAPRQAALLCNLSPSVLPRPFDWRANIHMDGYWFLPAPASWQPPDDLTDFLRRGVPPVYIGCGSMIGRDPQRLAGIILAGLRQAGLRGVLAAGWGGLSGVEPAEDIYWLEAAPHDWLFPHMAAVVHHGGAGTTAAGLKAGVPAVVTPFMQDQPFWAARLHRLGVSPPPLPSRQLTAGAFAERLTLAVGSSDIRNRARQLADKIALERGIERSLEIIEQTFS